MANQPILHPPVPEDLAKERTEKRARALSDAVVEAFTEKLKSEIQRHGGYLGLRHVEDIEREFQAKARQLSKVFAQAFYDATREQEALRWHAIKRPAFDRLMVKRFEHLFFHKGPDGHMQGLISRRMLPGFFLALNMMLGPQVLEEYHRRCDAAVDRVMQGRIPVDWDRVDQDPDARDVILDAQYAIALYFDDTERRYQWFIHIVNSHMADTRDPDDPEAHWELGYRALHMLVQGLLSDLKAAVADDAQWNRLTERHAGADRQRLAIILERLHDD